ncbi:MAG TPA: hypothetical protein VNP96_00625 [Solirubrobacterales bacterium]|nr:hypothetical protein [Solirubrobacterales bacterium]
MGSREDRRLNLKIGLAVLLVLVGLALFAYRPATLVGVSDESLAASLGDVGPGSCVEAADSRWECVIEDDPSSGNRRTLYVETRAFGCWDAWSNPELDRGGFSGCVTFVDLL